MLKVHKIIEEYCSFVSVLNIVEEIDIYVEHSIEVHDTNYFRTVTACNNFKLIDFQSKIDVLVSDIFKKIKDLEIDSEDFNEIQNDLIQLEEYLNFRKKDKTLFRYSPTPSMNIEFYSEFFESKKIVVKPNVFFRYVSQSIKLLINYLFNLKQSNSPKLKWNVDPALLGYLILELQNKGWIEPLKFQTENSPTKMARLCTQIFEYNGTEISLRNAIQNPSLSKGKQDLIQIPDINTISS